ncbi:rhodanese-like domain-containing protein [Mucilaginibacter calamicampi]|uniref:Rhodanese-like domain-containing protein n=1 Tax=Mucilaginibacter calamicampi TaxID=1302352 RepID=A0ABW2YYM7_9SPHI
MKNLSATLLLLFMALMANAQVSASMSMPATATPWSPTELMEPGELNYVIKSNKAPVIFNTGTVEDIKGAIHIGSINESANLEKLKTALKAHAKNTEIVVYCGCCPFGKCPNIRPAYKLLKDLGYTNVKVLNLYVNLRNNWTSAGYPLEKE